MPELPEVETIKRGLEKGLKGQQISDIKISWAKSFQSVILSNAKNLSPKDPSTPLRSAQDDIRAHVIGARIQSIERRAKVLIVNLSSGYSLLIHLKMTGQLVWDRKRSRTSPRSKSPTSFDRLVGGHPTPSMVHDLPDKSTRVIFEFTSGDKLFFNDQRKFGWIKLVKSNQVKSEKLIARLGPEPLAKDFSLSTFHFQLKRRAKSPIKPAILDQSVVSGVGNIYADESLHLAKIHPLRLAGSLKPVEIKALHAAIKTIIKSGIEHGGTSLTHYVNHMGGKGDYLKYARVFRRTGEPCPVCGTAIKKIRVAGRGTHFCPTCQKVQG